MSVKIRLETPADYRAVEELNRRLRELGFVEKLPPSATWTKASNCFRFMNMLPFHFLRLSFSSL